MSVLADAFARVRTSWTMFERMRDSSIFIDAGITMSSHLSKTVASCFAAFRQLRNIQRSPSRPVLLPLVTSLVLPRLDYAWVQFLQAFPNTCWIVSSRFSMQQHPSAHVSPLLQELHRLSVPKQVFCLCRVCSLFRNIFRGDCKFSYPSLVRLALSTRFSLVILFCFF